MPTQPAALLARAADLLVWRQVFILKTAFPAQYGFPGPTVAMSRKLWPMAMGWWVYGISGVIALKYLNVPMFSSFRRFTTIIVMYGEYRLYGTRAYSPPPSLSFPPFPPPLLRPPPVVSIEKPHSARRQHACAARAHTHRTGTRTMPHKPHARAGPPADQRNAVIVMSAGAAIAGVPASACSEPS